VARKADMVAMGQTLFFVAHDACVRAWCAVLPDEKRQP
jgi:hypothetical protein